jgi:hypothetical protein
MARLRVAALIGAAVMVSALAARPHVPAKLDRPPAAWAKHPSTPFVRTLIQVRPGTAAHVARELALLSPPLGVESTSDSLVADLSPAGLFAANLDDNVIRLSVESRHAGFPSTILVKNNFQRIDEAHLRAKR